MVTETPASEHFTFGCQTPYRTSLTLYENSAAQTVPQIRDFGISAGGTCRNPYFKVLVIVQPGWRIPASDLM